HLRTVLTEGTRLVVVGAGLIGAEVASSALTLGANVTLVDPLDPPLIPAIGEELAKRLHAMHTEKGVTVIQGAPTEISVDDANVHKITLADGTLIEADVVLVGIGI